MYPSNGGGYGHYDANLDRGWSPYAISSAGPPPATPSYSYTPSPPQPQSPPRQQQQYVPYQPLSGHLQYTYGAGGMPRVEYVNYSSGTTDFSQQRQQQSSTPSVYQSPRREYKTPVVATPPTYGGAKKGSSSGTHRGAFTVPETLPRASSSSKNTLTSSQSSPKHSSSSTSNPNKKTPALASSSSSVPGTPKTKKVSSSSSSVVSPEDYRKFISSATASAAAAAAATSAKTSSKVSAPAQPGADPKPVLSPLAQMRAYEEFKRSMAITVIDESSSSSSVSSPPLSPSTSSEVPLRDNPPSPPRVSTASEVQATELQSNIDTVPLVIDTHVETAEVAVEEPSGKLSPFPTPEQVVEPIVEPLPIHEEIHAPASVFGASTDEVDVAVTTATTATDIDVAEPSLGQSSSSVLSLHLSAEIPPAHAGLETSDADIPAKMEAATSPMDVDEQLPVPEPHVEDVDDDLTEEESEGFVPGEHSSIVQKTFCPTGDHTVPNTPSSIVDEVEADTDSEVSEVELVLPIPPSPTPVEVDVQSDEANVEPASAALSEEEVRRRIVHLVEYIAIGVAEKKFQFGKQMALVKACKRHLAIVQHLLMRGVVLLPDMYEIKSLVKSVPLMERDDFTRATLRQVPHLLRCRVRGFSLGEKKSAKPTTVPDESSSAAFVGVEVDDSLPPPSESRTKSARRSAPPTLAHVASVVGVINEQMSTGLKDIVRRRVERRTDTDGMDARPEKIPKKSEAHVSPSSSSETAKRRPAAMDLDGGSDTDDSETFNENLVKSLADIVEDSIRDVKRRVAEVLDEKAIRARLELAILRMLEKV